MEEKDLRSLYLRDLRRAPGVLSAIRRAGRRADRAAVLDFRRFADDPYLLYAAFGLAQQSGVTLTVPARPSDPGPTA